MAPKQRSKPTLAAVPRDEPKVDLMAERQAQRAALQQAVEAEMQRRAAETLAKDQAQRAAIQRPPRPHFSLEPHVLAVFTTLGFLLSARALLGLVLGGAFILGIYAMAKGNIISLVCLGIYGAITVPGLVYLELRKAPPK